MHIQLKEPIAIKGNVYDRNSFIKTKYKRTDDLEPLLREPLYLRSFCPEVAKFSLSSAILILIFRKPKEMPRKQLRMKQRKRNKSKQNCRKINRTENLENSKMWKRS